MDRKWLQKKFEEIGSRITIRTGTTIRNSNTPLRLNVAKDSKGEHFTLTIDKRIDEKIVEIQLLDMDKSLRHMLLMLKYPTIVPHPNPNIGFASERLIVGHDEMHWFVAGVTSSRNLKEAFERLRPQAVTIAMKNAKVKLKNQMRRKNKGFIRQGEWFFVPVHFEEDAHTVIHKNEPISRPRGTPHFVEELVRFGGKVVYVRGDQILTESQFKKLTKHEQIAFNQRMSGARVLARGKVKHRDHHTIELKGWHEVHLSTESGTSSNAFID
jgi:hypothetical protein